MQREYMEDYALLLDRDIKLYNQSNRFLFACVCDGHGGKKCAEWTSKNFVPKMQKFSMKLKEVDLCPLLYLTMKTLAAEWDKNETDTSGSTVNVCLLDRVTGILFFMNLGDSRALLINNETKKIELITRDHELESPEEKVKVKLRTLKKNGSKCRVTKTSGDCLRVQGQVAMSRAMGDNMEEIEGCLSREPDIYKFELQKPYNYTIVMGSDGLFDDLSNERVKEIAFDIEKNHLNASEYTRILKNAHKIDENQGTDNVSVVLIKTSFDD